MKSNKLIAEFMGVNIITLDDIRTNKNPYISSADGYLEDDLEYHTSWDWLMPVVNKCFDTWYYEYDSDDLCFLLNNALLTTNINEVYRVVTEFINEHNKNK